MRKLSLTFALCFGTFVCFAQKSRINGTVSDTAAKKQLQYSVITLLRQSDSVLISFTRSNKEGKFELNNLPQGKFVLLVTHPTYADYFDFLELKDSSLVTLPAIDLTPKSKLMEEIIVRQKISAVMIKGDTIEYRADSFKVAAGATVEDMLKTMPGIQVNSKGEITAQGKKVEKVLVDGEEFFGDDPTLATQNLNAKAVEKVQVFDKKSEEADITGVDDGQRTKTVNLVLKDDAKKGYFGRVEGGSDFNKFYEGKATANTFKGSKKTGAFISGSKTGRRNMNWEDERAFGTGYSSGVDENGGMYINFTGDDFDNGEIEGIPTNVSGALMYANKYGERKNSTNNNYNYRYRTNQGEGTTTTQYLLPDTVYYSNQNRKAEQTRWSHMLRTRNEWNLDSNTTINLNVTGSFNRNNRAGITFNETLTEDKLKVNNGERRSTAHTDTRSLNTELFFRRKLSKKGRLISATFTNNYNELDENGLLYNTNEFYSNGALVSSQLTDQQKTKDNNSNAFTGKLSFIEPFNKKWSLGVNYSYSNGRNEQDTRSFEKRGGKYDSLNTLFSNHFIFNNNSHQAGFTIRYNTTKLGFSIGAGLQGLNLRQKNLFNDSSFSRSFTNFVPNANMRYKISSSGNIGFRYNGQQQAPSLSQIQPLLDNTDPLNIYIGNPSLKPSFNHRFSIDAGSFKPLSGRNIYMWASGSVTQNAFGTKDVVDEFGRKIYQTVNVNGNYSIELNTGYDIKIKKLKEIYLGGGPVYSFSRFANFVNGVQNISRSTRAGMSIGVSKYTEKKYDFYVRYEPSFNNSKASVRPDIVTKYWTQDVLVYVNIHLPKDFKLNTHLEANFRQRTDVFTQNNNAVIWNTGIEKKLLKKKDLFVTVTINDILNQNIGFRRDVTTNYITERTFNTVRRFVLFGLKWRFNKNGAPSPEG
jgi:hypothetical protein